MNRSRVLTGAFIFLGLLLVACGASATATSSPPSGQAAAATTPPSGQSPRVVELDTIRSLAFEPSQIIVAAGEQIEFVISDKSGFGHTFTIATSQGKQSIIEDVQIKGNETKSVIVTFPEATSNLYLFCRPHERAGMTGTISVQ